MSDRVTIIPSFVMPETGKVYVQLEPAVMDRLRRIEAKLDRILGIPTEQGHDVRGDGYRHEG